jgi:hypothetical protein
VCNPILRERDGGVVDKAQDLVHVVPVPGAGVVSGGAAGDFAGLNEEYAGWFPSEPLTR